MIKFLSSIFVFFLILGLSLSTHALSVDAVEKYGKTEDYYWQVENKETRVNEQEPSKSSPFNRQVSLAVTISGGVSLGAYQAGYLYYLTETAKLNRDLFNLRLVTGASAGTINAMLTLMAMGQVDKDTSSPINSLFFKVWNEMKHNELLDVKSAPSGSLSSGRVLRQLAELIEKEWNKGLSADLDIVLGASATRLESKTLEVSEAFHVRTAEEKFVFRIQGQGKGRHPYVSNYVDPYHGFEQPLLPFSSLEDSEEKKRSDFSIIRQILFASSAIPVVFEPQEIAYCTTDPFGDKLKTTKCSSPTESAYFIDGGIVDRQPLRLAHRIARSGLYENKEREPRWRDIPYSEDKTLPDDLLFLYVDPMSPTYPTPKNQEEDQFFEDTAKVFKRAGKIFRGVFRSVQSKELYTLIEEHPDIRKRIQPATHDFPTMGGQMVNFFGFFDREIRKFDFYLGMRDARNFVEDVVTKRMRKQLGDERLSIILPDPSYNSKAASSGWQPYFCLRSVYDMGGHKSEKMCSSKDLKNFKILAQATLDRLYSQCRSAPRDKLQSGNSHCPAAAAKMNPPHMPGVPEISGTSWMQNKDSGESGFAHTIRLLTLYGFHFRDLGLEVGDGSLAMSRIREELLLYVDIFAKKLRYAEALAVRILGKPAINFFVYAPPAGIIYLVAGTGVELAFSATLGKSNWLRFNFALEFEGFNLFLTNKPNAFAITPAIGMELELYPISTPLLQTRLGARIGYQFSTEDRFMTGHCNTDWFENDPIRCSAPVAQFFIALVFYERIRLQAGIEWYPKWIPPMKTFDEHLFSGLVEVGWQWISPF